MIWIKLAVLTLMTEIWLVIASVVSAQPISIRLIDTSTPTSNWSSVDYTFSKDALQWQLNAVGEWYSGRRGFKVYGFLSGHSATYRTFVKNQCYFNDLPYAAFHWYDSKGPYGCVSSVNGGGYWWMTRALEHETTEMIADPYPFAHQEIVDSVAEHFGAICDGLFNYDYNCAGGYPFTDFLLPVGERAAYGHADFLKRVAP
jgi:hypothetical protein